MILPKLGNINPKMGSLAMKEIGIASALFSNVQGRVLALIFGHPDRSFLSGSICRIAESGECIAP
jgi:hypothetical protein